MRFSKRLSHCSSLLALFVLPAFIALLHTTTLTAATPRVDIVTGLNAPALEKFAAEELAGYLRRLYETDVSISSSASKNAQAIVLLGSPATNPAVASAGSWPKVSDQGIVIRNVQGSGANRVVVGGGSPVATLWAVYELAHRFGVRFLFRGDVYPAQPGELKLVDLDIKLEPNLRVRTWRTVNDFAIGPEAWGLDEHRRALRQLAKHKFNRVMLSLWPWQPFVHYEFRGVKKQTAMLWFGYRYPVDGDTAAKHVFRGAREFTNPAFEGKKSYEEMVTAGTNLAREIMAEAKRLGMSVAIAIQPLAFPKEFAKALPGAKVPHSLESLVIGPGAQQPPDDPLLRELVRAKIRAYIETYPDVDTIYFSMPEFPDWVEHHEAAWTRLDARYGVGKVTQLTRLLAGARSRSTIASGDRGVTALRGNIAALDFFSNLLSDPTLLKRVDGSAVRPKLTSVDPALFPLLDQLNLGDAGYLHLIDYTARRVAQNRDAIRQVSPAAAKKSSLIFTLADDNVGILPQFTTHSLHQLVEAIRESGWEGFSTRYWMVAELDPVVHYLSRASFDVTVTPESAYKDLLVPMSGTGVHDRLTLAYNMIEKATEIIDEQDIGFAFPVPGMMLKHYTRGPPPEWLPEVKSLYEKSMIEMFRSLGRSQTPGRPMINHLAKRLQLTYDYLNSIEALRFAGEAKKKGNDDELVEHLEKAVEAIYNGIDFMGEVAHDTCDRGHIALLNNYGYRPLSETLDKELTRIEGEN